MASSRSAAKRNVAYVDTSAFVALADRSDTFHPLFLRLFGDPPALITTPLVVAEGHAWFLRRYDSARALRFLSMIDEMTPLSIIATALVDVRAGAALLRRFSDQQLTLVDGVGLHVMAAHRIRSCWSTDFHLGLTGVPLVVNDG